MTFIKVDVDKCDEILYEMTLKALPTVIERSSIFYSFSFKRMTNSELTLDSSVQFFKKRKESEK